MVWLEVARRRPATSDSKVAAQKVVPAAICVALGHGRLWPLKRKGKEVRERVANASVGLTVVWHELEVASAWRAAWAATGVPERGRKQGRAAIHWVKRGDARTRGSTAVTLVLGGGEATGARMLHESGGL